MSETRSNRSAQVTPVSTPTGNRLTDNPNVLRSIISQKSVRIGDLEIEVATLKHHLEDADLNGDQARPQHRTEVATHTEIEDELAVARQQYQDLEIRHQKLQDAYERQKAKLTLAMNKYNAARDSAKQWSAYILKNVIAKESKAQGVASRHADDSVSEPPPPALPTDISNLDITPKPLRQTTPDRLAVEIQPQAVHESNVNPPAPSDPSEGMSRSRNSPSSSAQSKRITSSQTTEDDQPEVRSSPIKREADSDDAPVVVREVNLRRRRGESVSKMPPPRRIKQEPESPERPGSAEEPIELRSEDWSSPPTRSRPLIRMETSDLDAMRGTFQTPRKRKSRDESHSRARSEERSRATLHPPLTRNSSSLSDSDIPEIPELSTMFERVTTLKNNDQAPLPLAVTVTPNTRSHGRRPGALGQLSPNVPTLPQTSNKRRRISQEDAGKVSMLAEDGDDTSSQTTPKAESGHKPASQRLAGLLENPTPGRQPLQPRRPAPDTTKRVRPQRPQPQLQPQPQTPQPTSHRKPVPRTSKYARPPGIAKSSPPIDPASEPLRNKPKHLLQPHNFRINPAYADSDFAFEQPMNRLSKADRRCLPGCINPACCGEFLDAARNGLLPPSNKSDALLLEEMLGPSHAAVMAQYPPSQHEEIVFQARAQEFANKHGKHRKTFERAATPPGFWRTDMPSTQEEMEDRRKAEEIERMKVEGMWREAMKGGGRWLFRDE